MSSQKKRPNTQIIEVLSWNHEVYTWSKMWRLTNLYISVFNQRSSVLKNQTHMKPSRSVIFPLLRMIQSNLRISLFLAVRCTIQLRNSLCTDETTSCRPHGGDTVWLSCQRILAVSQIYIFIYKKHVPLVSTLGSSEVFQHRILESSSIIL